MFSADHTLWYTRPAATWSQALPIGNGRMGGMVWGGGRIEKISLNEDSVWGGAPYTPAQASSRSHLDIIRQLVFDGKYVEADALATKTFMGRPAHMASYQPVGELIIEMTNFDACTPQDYRRSLHLDSAMAIVRFQIRGQTFWRTIFVHPERQVLVVHLETDTPGGLSFNLTANSPQSSTLKTEDTSELVMDGRATMENGLSGAVRFSCRAMVKANCGSVNDADDHIEVRNATRATIITAIATNFRSYDDLTVDYRALATSQVQQAALHDFENLVDETTRLHRALYLRIHLHLGDSSQSLLPTDERLEGFRKGIEDPSLAVLYFNYGRYLLISSSRPGSQPANLQGIWNQELRPSWGSHFTLNINLQMNYWPAEVSGLSEMVEPLIAMVKDLSITGKHTAQTMYGARGWVTHHNTDIWRASAPIELPIYGQWPLSGPWLCRHLWDRYDYGRDTQFLASIYPILQQSSLFYVDFLVEDPKTGYLVTNPSMSPENIHPFGVAICAGPTMDSQLLRDLFTWTIQASAILGIEEQLRDQLSSLRSQLPPTEIGLAGQIKEWQEDWDSSVPDVDHRHTSHLYGLYPSNQISIQETPKLAAASAQTLLQRGAADTGWATAWRMNLWARLANGDKAYDMLRELLSAKMCYDNLFDAHPALDKGSISVFQIDGNFGGTAAIVEMLVQNDKSGTIHLLPALPRAWPEGRLAGGRIRGGLEVDLKWSRGRLETVTVQANIMGGEQLLVYEKLAKRIHVEQGKPLTLRGEDFIHSTL